MGRTTATISISINLQAAKATRCHLERALARALQQTPDGQDSTRFLSSSDDERNNGQNEPTEQAHDTAKTTKRAADHHRQHTHASRANALLNPSSFLHSSLARREPQPLAHHPPRTRPGRAFSLPPRSLRLSHSSRRWKNAGRQVRHLLCNGSCPATRDWEERGLLICPSFLQVHWSGVSHDLKSSHWYAIRPKTRSDGSRMLTLCTTGTSFVITKKVRDPFPRRRKRTTPRCRRTMHAGGTAALTATLCDIGVNASRGAAWL